MVRVISQETYDEVVKENIEDLLMTPKDAVEDAIEQFKAQGVDLSNIIKDLALMDGSEHQVCTSVAALRGLHETWAQHREELTTQLEILKMECSKDLARRVRAGKEGAYVTLVILLEKVLKCRSQDLIVLLLATLDRLMDTQPDRLDDRGVHLMNNLIESNSNEDVRCGTLRWVATCCLRHEPNRQAFFKSGLVSKLLTLLNKSLSGAVLTELLLVFRRLVLDDDIRVEFGKAHEHAREIALHSLPRLTQLLKDNAEDPELASSLLHTLAALLVRHEFCQTVADAGGAAILCDVTARHYDDVAVTQQALKLIKALAGNDDVKRSLVGAGIIPVVVSLLNRHMSNVKATALCLGCASAVVLRCPENGRQFVSAGGAVAVVEAMQKHSSQVSVQKNACYAIRNTVARCRDLNEAFLELGVEDCLNDAWKRFGSELEQDAKAALRDLECDVKLEEQWKGTGVQMTYD